MTTNPQPARPPFSYLALGDSYTIGEGVDAVARWPVQLAGLLRQDGIDVADPDIIAQTGWTANKLRNAIRESGNQNTYDLVSLLIGVNNQYRGRSLKRYCTDFRTLLQTAVTFAQGKPGRVFVLSIPDWGVTPFAKRRNRTKIASEINAFNAVARDECRKAGITFVDITPLSRQAAGESTAPVPAGNRGIAPERRPPECRTTAHRGSPPGPERDQPDDNSQFAQDGLHYSEKQMRQWAELTLPVVTELLTKL